MKLISYVYQESERFGAVVGDAVYDLKKHFIARYADLKALIADLGALEEELKAIIAREQPDCSVSDITFLPVIPNPGKIVCAGLNYHAHRIEANRDATANPTIFFRVGNSQIGHLAPLIKPLESDKLDYEGEVAVIIGKKGRRIPEEQAYEYVAGYSCYNDGSIRDYQGHTSQWSPGKNFEGTGAFGPWMVTRGEIADGEVLTLETRLDGEVMQNVTTDLMIFSIPRLIAYVSSFTTLEPGDVIVSGTPGGVGFKRTPPVYMKPGQTVEVEVSKIGTLTNRIAADA